MNFQAYLTQRAARSRWQLQADDAQADDALAYSNVQTTGLSAESATWTVVAFVGLTFEARIAAGPGVLVVCRSPECELSSLLQMALSRGCRSIISFGIAGGLAPDLRPGDCIVASAVLDSQALRPTDQNWSRKLLRMVPNVRHGLVVGVNSVIADPRAKRELHARTGAVAVDMESHLVAQAAAMHGMAFTAVRVVVDPADRAVPAAALTAMCASGRTDLMAMLREVMQRPSQLSSLLRLAADAYIARNALLKLRQIIGPAFGFASEDELLVTASRERESAPEPAP